MFILVLSYLLLLIWSSHLVVVCEWLAYSYLLSFTGLSTKDF
jgi:hypothetical protein